MREALKRLVSKLFRLVIWLVVIGLGIFVIVLIDEHYDTKERLEYMTGNDCERHDYETQICETDDGFLYLRNIDMEDNRLSIMYLHDDPSWDKYRYAHEIYWFVGCEEGFSIETDSVFSDGMPQIISCSQEDSPFLKNSVSRLQINRISASTKDVSFNYGGFNINHDYTSKDFSPLLRRLTLNNGDIEKERKARLKEEEEQRLKQKNLEEERLKKEELKRLKKQKLEKERLEKQAAARQACFDRNASARKNLTKKIQTEKRAILSKGFSHKCETENGVYVRYCERHELAIFNLSDFVIKEFEIGYERYKVCSSKPRFTKTLIPTRTGYGNHTQTLFEWSASDPYCIKLLDVEFEDSFVPEDCYQY
jgi:hypothetical protein